MKVARFLLICILLTLLVSTPVFGAKPGKPPPPPSLSQKLILKEGTNQLAVSDTFAKKAIYLFDICSNTEYENTWNSTSGSSEYVDIGDADNDGYKEIVSVFTVFTSKGVGRRWVSDLRLNLWENGSLSSPTITTSLGDIFHSSARDLKIADADNDGKNEVVLACGNYIAVLEYSFLILGFELLWKSEDTGALIWSVSIGDVDNDGFNEVVGARFRDGYALVWKYARGAWVEVGKTESIGQYNIDCAEVGDVDNDGLNEIVGGGTSNRINIWKFNRTNYKSIWISDDLGGFTQGVGVGDVDGDGRNEIVAGASNSTLSKLHVIKFNVTQYAIVWSHNLGSPIDIVRVGDSDNDGENEFVVGGKYLSIFKHGTSQYYLAWTRNLGVELSSIAIG